MRAGDPGQLEQELASSSWLMTDVDPQLIFGVPADEMWETAIRRLGADPGRAADESRRPLTAPPGRRRFAMLRHMAATLDRSALGRTAALAPACSPARRRSRQRPAAGTAPPTDPMLQKIQTMTARFAPVDLTADVSPLPANERQALAKMIEAARVFDALYLRQVWEGNEALLVELVRTRRRSAARGCTTSC